MSCGSVTRAQCTKRLTLLIGNHLIRNQNSTSPSEKSTEALLSPMERLGLRVHDEDMARKEAEECEKPNNKSAARKDRVTLVIASFFLTLTLGVCLFLVSLESINGIGMRRSQHPSKAITRVGHRQNYPRYYSVSSCTSNQFLNSLSRARINPAGRSRSIDRNEYYNSTTALALPTSFEYSFKLDGCKQPHVFTSSEACDLVTSFGGIFMKGDSLIRHLHTALMMLLVRHNLPISSCLMIVMELI